MAKKSKTQSKRAFCKNRLTKKWNLGYKQDMLRRRVSENVLIVAAGLKRVDVLSSPILRKEIQEIIEQEGKGNVVIDLSSVEFIDSAGLVGLLAIWKNLRKKKGELKIAEVQPQVKQLIELVLLNRVFSVYETVEEALNSFQPSAISDK